MIVVCFSIFTLFASEIFDAVKKFFKIPGMMLAVPLLFFSWLVTQFDYIFIVIFTETREILFLLQKVIAKIIPFSTWSSPVAQVILLTIIPIIPLFIARMMRRRHKGIYIYPHSLYCACAFIWILTVELFFAS